MEYALVVPQANIDKLLDHAEDCLPLEAVALLFGVIEEDRIIARSIELLDNVANSRTTFLVDPVIQYNLLVDAEERGEDLVCIFHSHPAPPVPSSTDLRNMKLNPVVWLIASKITGQWEYKAYLLRENQEYAVIRIINS
ncbi:MAG: Mov34/MPN/PAD-1 family protein [Candidatus Thorarchaeota archaeon]